MKRVKDVLSDVLILAGASALVYAGFLILPVVGWGMLGVALIALGVVFGLEGRQ